MEDKDILTMWRSYDERLQESLTLNRKNAEEITRMKVQSFLASMKPMKIFTLIAGILWVLLVDFILVASFRSASPFFYVSMGIQVLLTKLAIGVYIYQLYLLNRADIGEPVLETQEKIARLQSSTIWVTRLLFLQLPVWTTFFWSKRLFADANALQIAIPVVIAALFTWAAVWLFINIRFENKDKKWFRLIFRGKEWDPMLKANDLLHQVQDYK
ncbi:hypothetical protein [Paraflavitalea sp. CAU 1676]|uniref:hypothetical protein n=1 Tax=Paraflavitalea sp. CAU 1676 TaxID=3032598 RepID=UPI0023DCC198|nr:hypothetical protein [Paraflavitalea sp. CAU 1676]MDF2188221.1 hypothetical protein [Paraflavitalea sp. CAU 1676]